MTTIDTDHDAIVAAQRQEKVAGLRALADFLDRHPDLADRYAENRHYVYVGQGALDDEQDPKDVLAEFARAAKAAGIPVRKEYDGSWGQIHLGFGPIDMQVYAERDQVCERVVTGVETVTEQVPDPEALKAVPTVEVTREVEQIEWRCLPLLDTTEQVSV